MCFDNYFYKQTTLKNHDFVDYDLKESMVFMYPSYDSVGPSFNKNKALAQLCYFQYS